MAAGSYCTVNLTGLILSSDDGVSWTQRLSSSASAFYGVRYVGGKFIAVGSSGYAAVSTNGIDWTSLVVSNFTTLYLRGAAYGNGQYVIIGYQYVSGVNIPVIFTSTDAVAPGIGVDLDISGEIGRGYRLQSTTNFQSWYDQFAYTNNAPVIRVTDPSGSSDPKRFYRSVTP